MARPIEPDESRDRAAPGAPHVFIVHADEDVGFVEGYLVPALRLNDSDVLLSSRLTPGSPIVREYARGALSPVSILVLSQAFHRSVWARFAEELAHHQGISVAADTRPIPLFVDDCAPPVLSASIVALNFREQNRSRWDIEATRLRERVTAALIHDAVGSSSRACVAGASPIAQGAPAADSNLEAYVRQGHATRHQLATNVVRAVHQVRWTMPGAADTWHNWRLNQRPSEHASLVTALDAFGRSIASFEHERDQVRAVWGEQIAAPLQTFGDTCAILHSIIVLDVTGRVLRSVADRDYAESRAGGRRREEIEEFARLIEDWAAPFLGRPGAVELTEDDVATRAWRISGLPEDQVQDIVAVNTVVRQARKTGRTRKEIRALVEKWWVDRRNSRRLSTTALDAGGVPASEILTELARVVAESVANGETSVRVRLTDNLDKALEIAFEANAGAVSEILGGHIHEIAKGHPSLTYVQIAAGDLPEQGWTVSRRL